MRLTLLLLAAACCAPGQTTFPLQTPQDDFSPTVLDLSSYIEAPTGKHGFVQRRGDQFVFEDGTPVRFWGAQINVFPKDKIEYTARRLRKQGINLVRLHGLNFLNPRKAASILDYDKDAFDRLDFLIAALGKNGVYIILDTDYPLNVAFGPKDGIPGLENGGPAPFAEFFNHRVAELKQQRMRDVFTHLNPYTKKRYADDPTLAMVEMLNEDSLFWYPDNMREPFKSQLRDACGSDLVAIYNFNERYFAQNPNLRERGARTLRCYLDLEAKFWENSRRVLREAGLRVPVSGTNWQGGGFTTRVHMLGQSKLDYIDRHGYWDHPQGQGNAKWRISTARFLNLPMLKSMITGNNPAEENNAGNLVLSKAWQRVFGMPMTISEWNSCRPNEYSLEGTGVMAAYGLLQDWNGLLEFAYSSPDWLPAPRESSFDLLDNPPQILQFPAAAAMWYRHDVDSAPVVGELLYSPQSVFDLVSDKMPVPVAAALVGKVGLRFSDAAKPVAVDVARYWDAETRIARSITGQLTWDARRGVVSVNTPRTQAVIGFLSQGSAPLDAVLLQTPSTFGAVYVTAMDGTESIRSAKRLLVTTVGTARNTGMEYEQTSETSGKYKTPLWRIKTLGGGPVLMDAIDGELRITSKHAARLRAWTLDVNGKRGAEVKLARAGGAVTLPLQRSVYYELSVP